MSLFVCDDRSESADKYVVLVFQQAFGILRHSNVRQVSIHLTNVQSVPDYKVIRNREADVLRVDLDLVTFWLIEQRSDGQRTDFTRTKDVRHIVQSQSGVDDVFDDQHIFCSEAYIKVLGDPNFA